MGEIGESAMIGCRWSQRARRVTSLVAAIALAIGCAACGGGDGGVGGGGGSADTLAPEARQASLDRAAAQLSTVVNSGTGRQDSGAIDTWMTDFAAFLAQDSRLTDIAIDRELQVITAQFTDGVPYAVVFNRLLPEPPEDDPTLEELEADATRAVNGIPNGTDAVLINCLGPGFKGDHARIHTALSNGGYSVRSLTGTLTNLYNLAVNPAILYWEAHGGTGKFVDGETNQLRPQYSLWTATKVDPNDSQYAFYVQESIQRQKLTIMLTSADVVNNKAVMENRWAVTANFIRNHITFAPDGLFFNDCCYGQHAVAGLLRAAVFAQGAGVYAGWTNPADNKNQALFFFDLTAGANSYVQGSPDYRPFSYPDVYARMQQNGLATYRSTLGPSLLTFTPTTGQPDSTEAIRPTIQQLEVVADADGLPAEDLLLLGTFGRDPQSVGYPAEVTVNDVPLNVVSWEHNRVRCDLPSEGSGAGGPVQVTVNGLESNEVPLTLWHGTMELAYDPHLTTLHSRLVLDVLFRGDIHRYRTAPRNNLLVAPLNFFSVPRSNAGFAEGTGTHQANDVLYTGLNGPPLATPDRRTMESVLPLGASRQIVTQPDNTAFVAGNLNSVTRQVELCVYFLGFTNLLITAPGVSYQTPFPVIAPYADQYTALYDRGRGIVGCYDLTMTSGMVIPGGARHIQFVNDEGNTVDVDLTWTDLTPLFLPDNNDPA